MSWVEPRGTRFLARWREDGIRRSRIFDTREEAEAHVAHMRVPLRKREPKYNAVHKRAGKVLLRACAVCGTTKNLAVALRHDAPVETLRIHVRRDETVERRYSVAFPPETAYVRLCRKHHVEYDMVGRTVGTSGLSTPPVAAGGSQDGSDLSWRNPTI